MVQEREGEADCVTFLSFFLFPFPHCVCCSDSRYSSCAASAQNQEHSWALNFTELDTYCNFPASQLLSAAHASLQMLASKTVDLPTERKKTVLPSWAEGSDKVPTSSELAAAPTVWPQQSVSTGKQRNLSSGLWAQVTIWLSGCRAILCPQECVRAVMAAVWFPQSG